MSELYAVLQEVASQTNHKSQITEYNNNTEEVYIKSNNGYIL